MMVLCETEPNLVDSVFRLGGGIRIQRLINPNGKGECKQNQLKESLPEHNIHDEIDAHM